MAHIFENGKGWDLAHFFQKISDLDQIISDQFFQIARNDFLQRTSVNYIEEAKEEVKNLVFGFVNR